MDDVSFLLLGYQHRHFRSWQGRKQAKFLQPWHHIEFPKLVFLSKGLRGDREERKTLGSASLPEALSHMPTGRQILIVTQLRSLQIIAFPSIWCYWCDSSPCEVGGTDLAWPLISLKSQIILFCTDWKSKWVNTISTVVRYNIDQGAVLFTYYFIWCLLGFSYY